MYFESVKY